MDRADSTICSSLTLRALPPFACRAKKRVEAVSRQLSTATSRAAKQTAAAMREEGVRFVPSELGRNKMPRLPKKGGECPVGSLRVAEVHLAKPCRSHDSVFRSSLSLKTTELPNAVKRRQASTVRQPRHELVRSSAPRLGSNLACVRVRTVACPGVQT